MPQVPTRYPPPRPVASTNHIPVQNKWLRPGDPLPALGPRVTGTRLSSVGPYKFAWRQRLRMASFKSAPFYVEQQGRSSGRRTVLHQYPKRDLPYAEDMGREALRYQITGYLIQAPTNPASSRPTDLNYLGMDRDYDVARDFLESKLMEKSPGRLLDPYNPWLGSLTGYPGQGPLLFMCERYTIIESRQKGGFCQLEMAFVEAGIPGSSNAPMISTAVIVANAANAAVRAAANQLDGQQQRAQGT
jgi:hypothetical protein